MTKAKSTKAQKKGADRKIIHVEIRTTFGLVFPNKETCASFAKNPSFEMEFRPSNAEDENTAINVKPVGDNPITLEAYAFTIAAKGKKIVVEIGNIFSIEVDANVDDDNFDSWAYDESGANCWEISPVSDDDVEMDEDFEGGTTYVGTKNAYGVPISEFIGSHKE